MDKINTPAAQEENGSNKSNRIEIIQSFEKLIRDSETANDLVWNVVGHIHAMLGYDDCVLYFQNKSKSNLIQAAAYGKTKVDNRRLKNPIYIEPGEGIVGRVFQSGISRLIGDTSKDGNYIIDDRFRLSEIAVPIPCNGKIIGVLDSEHPSENYYTQNDLALLTEIAHLIGQKMTDFNEDFFD